MYLEIRPYLDIPWHEWMFPIGPLVGDRKSMPYVLMYAATWGDILYMVSCEGYVGRYIDAYILLLELHSMGCSMMVSTNESTMLMRWLHVIASVGIHIDVLESLDSKIGGNWAGAIHSLREIQTNMAAESGTNLGLINRITEQVSMKSITNPNTGAPCGGRNGNKFNAGYLKDGWCKNVGV
jgi:hypothetical protein